LIINKILRLKYDLGEVPKYVKWLNVLDLIKQKTHINNKYSDIEPILNCVLEKYVLKKIIRPKS
jgi:hypothetical protein